MQHKNRYRRLHILQNITAILLFLAFLFLAGTAGSLEMDTIGLGQACLQLIGGIIVSVPLVYFFQYLWELEQSMREQDRIIAERRQRREEYWKSYFCG